VGCAFNSGFKLVLRVLVIEDEPLTALYLASLLEEMGCERVAVAHSEAEAYRLADGLEPNLIVADVNLGFGGSGMRAAQRLARERDLSVIFVTGNRDQIEDSLFDGVVALIDKPLNPIALRAAVAQQLCTTSIV
jgi:CheY-like chemotaxis protein